MLKNKKSKPVKYNSGERAKINEKLKEKFDIVIPDENTLCYDEGSEIDSMIQWANDKNIEFDVILSSLRKQGFKKSLQQMSFKLIKSGGSIKEQKWWSE